MWSPLVLFNTILTCWREYWREDDVKTCVYSHKIWNPIVLAIETKTCVVMCSPHVNNKKKKKRIPIEFIGWSQTQWTKLQTIRWGRFNLMCTNKMIAWSESHALKLEPTHKLKWAWWIPKDMVERMWGKECWYKFFEMIYSPL